MAFDTTTLTKARESGYSDEEVGAFLSQSDPRVQTALSSGYSLDEIATHFDSQKPQESQPLSDIGRQFVASVAKSTIDPLIMASRIGSKLPAGKLSETVSGITGAPPTEEILTEMEGASARAGDEYGVNPKFQDTFVSQVARGFGQAVPTLAAGRAAPVVSALMAGEQGFQEAQSFGATGAKLIAATGVNATTALVTEKLMGVPKILGLIKNAKPVASSVLKTALKTAGFEGSQEVLEQIMQDWTAQKLYDPKRKIFDWGKLATVFGVGAFVGSGVGGVLQTAQNLSTPKLTGIIDPKTVAPKEQVQEVAKAVDESLAQLATEEPPAAPPAQEPTQTIEPVQPTASEPTPAVPSLDAPMDIREGLSLKEWIEKRVSEGSTREQAQAEFTEQKNKANQWLDNLPTGSVVERPHSQGGGTFVKEADGTLRSTDGSGQVHSGGVLGFKLVNKSAKGQPRIVSTGIMTPEGIATGSAWNTGHADISKIPGPGKEIVLKAMGAGMTADELDANKGFIVEENGKQRFVGRKEALEIARKSGQVDESVLYSPEKQGLISEALIEPQNAQAIRSNEGQIPPGGDVLRPSAEQSGGNLQQQTPGTPDVQQAQPKVSPEEAAVALQAYRDQAIDAARKAGATDPELAASIAQQQTAEKGNQDPALFIETARRRGLDQQRGTQPTTPQENAPEAAVERGPRAETISQEDVQSLDEAVNQLPEVQRSIIRELESNPDLTDQGVASALNLTIDQVKKAKSAFRKTMREFIQSQGIGARLGPGAANVEETLAQYEERKFGKRFQETEGIAPEIKEATGNRYYEIIPNRVTAERATEIIDKNGEQNAEEQIRDESSGLSYADRSTVGQILIKRYNDQYKDLKNTNPEEASRVLDRASSLAEWGAEYGTRLAQGLQSFSMWERLTPEGKLRTFQKMVRKKRDQFTRDNRNDIDEIKDTLNGATKENATKASGSTRVRSKLASSKRKPKPEGEKKEKPRPKSLDRDVWVQYQQQAIKNIETALFSGKPQEQPALQEFTNRLVTALKGKIPAKITEPKTAQERKAEDIRVIREAMTNREKYEEVWTNTTNALKLRYGNRPDILKKIDEVFAGGLKNPLNPKTLQSLIRERIKSDEIKLSELVRKHYSKAEEQGKSLADKISEEIGLDEAGSLEVANAIESEFAAEVTKTKARALASLVKTNPTAKKISKSDAQKLMEVSNLGALTDQTFYDSVSESLGLPEYSPAVAAEIMRLATRAEQAPEGMPKMEATLELNKFIARQKGFDPSDLLFGIYYGNILSGGWTQAINLIDTALNVQNEIAVLAIQNPKAAAEIASAMAKGASMGKYDSLMAIMKGRRISDGKFVEDPFFMETAQFGKKGGVPIKQDTRIGRVAKRFAESKVATPLNLYKYIGRAMSASDALAFRSAMEAKSAQLAFKIANDNDSSVDKILGYDRIPEFREQAKSEGYTGYQAEARANELMMMSRPPELQKASRDFASDATYNVRPYGLMGSISNGIESITRDYKIGKLVVPFTRIVANVVNRGMNNSPYGYVNAIRGKAGHGKSTRVFSPEERNAMLIRASVATALMATVVALHESGVITIHGSGPNDPEKKRQLRQTGWKPYTIQIGDRYISYNYTPWGLMMAATGNWLDNDKYKDFSSQEGFDKLTYSVQSVASTVFNQSFLSGLSGLFDVISGRSSAIPAGRRFVSSTVTGLTVPFSSATKDVESLVSDPNVPKVENMRQAIIANIPFASQGLKPQLNAFGEPIKSQRNRLLSSSTDDPVWRAVAERGWRIPVPNTFFDNPEDQYGYHQEQGKMLRKWMEQNLPRLKNMDKKHAQDAIENASDQFRMRTRNRMLREGSKKKAK